MNCNDLATLCPLYLSGELDPAGRTALAEHLQVCRACATELERQRQLDTGLRDSILSEPIENAALDQRIRLRILAERHHSRMRRLAIAAGLAAILFGGSLGYRSILRAKAPRLFADAAQDHRNEVVRRQPRTWLTDPKRMADLAQRNGIPAQVLATLMPPGYRLTEAKLCRLDGRIFLHLVYAQGDGQFSTFLRARDAQPLPGAIRETDNGKPLYELASGVQHIASFQTDELTVVFVTDGSGTAALSLARFAAQQL